MIAQLQKNLVQEISSFAPEGWKKIKVNIEIDEVNGEIVMSPKSEYFMDEESDELCLGIDATDCFEQLREAMVRNDSQKRAWTICDLEILSDGAFKFDFLYHAPPRLSKLR